MDGIMLYLFVLVINPAIHVALLGAAIMLLKQAITMRKIPPHAQTFLIALLAVVIIDLNLFGTSWLRSKFDSNYYTVEKPIAISHANQVVPGTPDFAVREITRAVQEQNGELFLQYVDVDGILADVAKNIPGMQTAKMKKQILDEIVSGKAKLPTQNGSPVMFLFDNWIVGGLPSAVIQRTATAKQSPLLSLGTLDEHKPGEPAYLQVSVDSSRTPVGWYSGNRVKFKLIKAGSEYRVVADDQTTAGLIQRYNRYVKEPPKPLERNYELIKEEWQRIIQYEIKAVRSEFEERYRNADLKTLIVECWPYETLDKGEYGRRSYARPQVTVRLKNVHAKPIDYVGFMVRFRESGGERRYWANSSLSKRLSKEKGPLEPGESREITFEMEKLTYTKHYYLSTGAYQVEIFPSGIEFVDGQRIRDNGQPSLEYRQK